MTGPLPPLDANLILTTLKLELERDERGQEWCRASGVGGLRKKKLGLLPQTGVDVSDVEEPLDEARRLLEQICFVCPFIACPMNGK